MSKLRDEIVALINESSPPYKDINDWVAGKYLGSKRRFLGLPTNDKRRLAKHWKKEHPDISQSELFQLIDELYQGDTFEEATFASELLNLFPEHRRDMSLDYIYKWLGMLNGWAEIDALCQSTFQASEVLPRWDEWEKLLKKLNKDEDIRRRRASLVLLRKTVDQSNDPRVAKMVFENISNVMHEKEVLITKAISWLLRSLTQNYRDDVEDFITLYEDKLPKIALRETRRKLETGRK